LFSDGILSPLDNVRRILGRQSRGVHELDVVRDDHHRPVGSSLELDLNFGRHPLGHSFWKTNNQPVVYLTLNVVNLPVD
jgi:hypothetical protein